MNFRKTELNRTELKQLINLVKNIKSAYFYLHEFFSHDSNLFQTHNRIDIVFHSTFVDFQVEP